MTDDELTKIKQRIDEYLPDSIPLNAPERPKPHQNSRSKWNSNQWRAAAMRAKEEPWSTVIAYLGISMSTATKYPTCNPGWNKLREWFVEWYRAKRIEDFLEKEETTVFEGTGAALDLIVGVINGEEFNGKRPSLHLRTRTAFQFMKLVGYEEAKRLITRDQVDRILQDPELEDAADDTEIDPRIEYQDDDGNVIIDVEVVDD